MRANFLGGRIEKRGEEFFRIIPEYFTNSKKHWPLIETVVGEGWFEIVRGSFFIGGKVVRKFLRLEAFFKA